MLKLLRISMLKSIEIFIGIRFFVRLHIWVTGVRLELERCYWIWMVNSTSSSKLDDPQDNSKDISSSDTSDNTLFSLLTALSVISLCKHVYASTTCDVTDLFIFSPEVTLEYDIDRPGRCYWACLAITILGNTKFIDTGFFSCFLKVKFFSVIMSHFSM